MNRHVAALTVVTGFCFAETGDAAMVDPNFTETVYASAGNQVTGLAWAPDGSDRLFVSRKAGQITVIKNGTVLGTPFATLSPIFLQSECGLIGICFDPNFIVNGYVYVFVTVSASEQQIIRYTAVGDIGINKTILVPGLPTAGVNHDGGAVGIGADGELYWAVGDNGNGTGVNADMLSLASKVGRANLDGTVPTDNPFVDGPGGTNDYIWARGFRNPFTFNFQPSTGELWVNSVGDLYEQIFLVRAGDHAGWINYENNQPAGYIKPKIKYRTNSTDARNVVAGTGAVRSGNRVTFTTSTIHGFRQGEKITVSGVTDSSFNGDYYVASTPTATTFTVNQAGPDTTSGGGTATTQHLGGAVAGGCFFESTGVPSSYRGNLFFGDFTGHLVIRAILGSTNEVLSVDYVSTNIGYFIDAAVGPDGALYYVGYGGTVYRSSYNFSSQQLVVTPTVVRMFEGGLAALTVRLATAPASNVTVNVASTSGDPNISILTGSNLTFTAANWSVPQIVRLHAAVDGDAVSDVATLTVSAIGLNSEQVTVHALDLPPARPMIGPLTREPGPNPQPAIVGLTGETGRTYVIEASTNLLAPWKPLSTNLLIGSSTNIIDFDSTNLPMRFYRARVP